ncbi:hypothetical protein QBC32DRAFT_136830 [Pseudoneurospora amorphoporcata]|uniref:Cation efflux protein cytoplasmic domain-containing protein n=1 Tax=Pseudoneurospora amorphoporcata TaxID=241081 RepID=A0AAN6P448_9PEZI|nr:hypothetical protein QBC32DRAFT_136830 [Pseudoneurospora amorphoporcata]
MASPNYPHSHHPSNRSGPFLCLQEPQPPAPKGHSALASLIRNRPAVSLPNPLNPFRDDEEAFIGHGVERRLTDDEPPRRDERHMSAVLNGPHMRSMRLIGNSNPRYRWERYWKTEDELATMKKPIREYYERCNYLVQQYLYIDKLLDSSLPHDLLNEYNDLPPWAFRGGLEAPVTTPPTSGVTAEHAPTVSKARKVKRTPKGIYRPTETTPLFSDDSNAVYGEEGEQVTSQESRPEIPWLEDDDVDSSASIVTLAIYINFAANAILLAGKLAVVLSVPSVSVLASLVDAILDFLSTAIVWITTWLISRQDQYRYPIGRRRLEPIGVLVFSVIMITSFAQVALEAIQRLMSNDREVIQLGVPAIAIMLSTVVIKGMCWVWCRLIKNSSVQALAADASTDVIFNAGSIAFPLIGFYCQIWWLDALGGLLLSLVVIFNWSQTSGEHIRHLTGFSATADQRNILLYLTMRFAKTIKQIQGLQAYHSGDKLNVEVDIVLDASTSLKDSHDLAESLQYVIESVPIVDRAFVHVDYASYNLPTHMEQQHNS